MQPGTVLATPAARTAWLATRPAGWTIGWSVWILCAFSLVALLAALAQRLDRERAWAGAAVALAAAGAAVDVFCDAVWITVVPELAAAGPDRMFLAAERALSVGGNVAANGLYSAAVLVMVHVLPPGPGWRGPRLLGWLTAAGGLGLCAATLAGGSYAIALFAGMTMAAFIAWAVALARADFTPGA
jgi:hypothetical protein